ncbi:three-Cys-motif partner protein TcmP [Verrucosispora sp. WMMD1129]|uniref:three-Cys-motif partner protein TcmP n=1 Tax=Verrucosispora sp. WMMD1129 TaxID=3016093 RepID=UPI00249BE347|nr:three-Cys-motif partner protein TcmP [Verrucosispora sp. WMMD1129]WFE46369.1 three-Cys-motif partner protein TcmP [Verrucosispora sp. WMMD1129]
MSRRGGQRRSPRTWGYWTEQKLSMLAAYLPAFTKASQKSRRTLYLDLFAGQDRNLSRTTGEPISGSPRVALDTAPPFSKAVFFELPGQAAGLEAELRTSYPGRDFEVVPGDCNKTVSEVLERLTAEEWHWAPTFVLLDQQAAEIEWATLEALAKFKHRSRSKAELWLLFAPSMLPRGLASVDPEDAERFAKRVTAMFGTEVWRDAYEARQQGRLSAAELRDELLNLIRWRLENILGYKATHSFQMKNTRGADIYEMVFATDHDAGEKIMSHIYRMAADAQPRMRAEAVAKVEAEREEKSGVLSLIPPMAKVINTVPRYKHEPPREPYRLPADE